MFRFDTPTAQLRALAFFEGLSFVLLLFVAMPLKYLAGQPLAVRIVGMAHGVLFMALAFLVVAAIRQRGQSLGWGARIGVASLLPFGTFFLDKRFHREDEAYRRQLAESSR